MRKKKNKRQKKNKKGERSMEISLQTTLLVPKALDIYTSCPKSYFSLPDKFPALHFSPKPYLYILIVN